MAIRQRGAAWQADARVAGKRTRRDFATEAGALAWLASLKGKVQPTGPSAPAPETCAPKPGTLQTIGEAFDRAFARHYAGTKYEAKNVQKADVILSVWGRERPLTPLTKTRWMP